MRQDAIYLFLIFKNALDRRHLVEGEISILPLYFFFYFFRGGNNPFLESLV